MIAVFADKTSPRLKYILHVLATNWKTAYKLFTDKNEYALVNNKIKINYSTAPVSANEILIMPQGILHQHLVVGQEIIINQKELLPVFFAAQNGYGFDVLAAAFYLLTRYEEYLPHEKDMYGRYAHTNSLAFKNNFLEIPLVNLWFDALKLQAKTIFPAIAFEENQFKYIPTYDIDIAYSYKGKGLRRNVGGLVKSFIKVKFGEATKRLKTLAGISQDPFDTYDFLDALHNEYNLEPIYFFLLAPKAKGYDKNLSANTALMQKLIAAHGENYTLGIHPSWQSYLDEKLVESERELLEQISDRPIYKSRQHYIRLGLPESYRLLIAINIQEDYSMGYGSINGFRASYCMPYPWYDLENETMTSLIIYPFCYMEANSIFEQKLSAAAAGKEIVHYYNAIKNVNGTFISIFHNNFISKQPGFYQYRNMYADFLKSIHVDA